MRVDRRQCHSGLAAALWVWFLTICSLTRPIKTIDNSEDAFISRVRASLNGKCFHTARSANWWAYRWCSDQSLSQFHEEPKGAGSKWNDMDIFDGSAYDTSHENGDIVLRQFFHSAQEACQVKNKIQEDSILLNSYGFFTIQVPGLSEDIARKGEVVIRCCESHRRHRRNVENHNGRIHDMPDIFITGVNEPKSCNYEIHVCASMMCEDINHDNQKLKATKATNSRNGGDSVDWVEIVDDKDSKEQITGGTGRDQYNSNSNKNGCHMAYLPEHPTCRGYDQLGYTCVGDYCAYSGNDCKGNCKTCSKFYPNHVFDPITARCLDPSRRASVSYLSINDQLKQRERVRAMFTHAYDNYMTHAFPEAELKPISCRGGQFHLIKIPLVTLFDTLDTLAILGNYSEFRRAVHLINVSVTSFDIDVNVNVFETNIRILGGLLSAHLMASDPKLGIYQEVEKEGVYYDNALLNLAVDLGNRLLPAFDTPTGIPYGTVNLRKGVPPKETHIASTAGAGSLLVEFEVLSTITGDDRYGNVALRATVALFERRNSMGLLGKHINVQSGKWHETLSGIGSNADSFYEYLFKSSVLFREEKLFSQFSDTFISIKKYVQLGNWFSELDLINKKFRKYRFESLQAFWPGIEANMGLLQSSSRLLNTFYAVWNELGMLPEEMDYVKLYSNGQPSETSVHYPLRPELIESTYHHYRATLDNSWLSAAVTFLDNIENKTKTSCGYAAVERKDKKNSQVDSMPSFFLSETVKYLYLLFDENNFINKRSYVFSTEAHPFDSLQISKISHNNYSHFHEYLLNASITTTASSDESSKTPSSSLLTTPYLDPKNRVLPNKCRKRNWWENSLSSYDPNYSKLMASQAASTNFQDMKENWIENVPELFVSSKPTKVSSLSPELYRKQGSSSNVCHIDPRKHSHPQNFFRNDNTPNMDEPNNQRDYRKATTDDNKNDKSNDQNVDGNNKSVRVNINQLGEFNIEVYEDGFIVHSLRYGNTIEISNIGRGAVFVNDYGGHNDIDGVVNSDRTITGTLKRNTITCSVELSYKSDEDRNGDVVPLSLGNKGAHYKTDCSIAAFGATASMASTLLENEGDISKDSDKSNVNDTPETNVIWNDLIHVNAPLYIPIDDPFGCDGSTLVESDQQQNQPLDATKQPSSGDQSPQETDKRNTHDGREWSPFAWLKTNAVDLFSTHSTSRNGGFQNENIKENKNYGSDEVSNKIFFAKRGQCLFEDKSFQAANRGAVGNIIVNSERTKFVMAGSSTVMDRVQSTLPKVEDTRADLIPTVMVSRSDGMILESTINHLRAKHVQSSVDIKIDSIPYFFDNAFNGFMEYPKIRMTKSFIIVQSRAAWSTVLSTTNERPGEWQIFITPTQRTEYQIWPGVAYSSHSLSSSSASLIDGKDHDHHSENEVSKQGKGNGSNISIPSPITLNPILIYKRLLSQKCSDELFVDRDGRVVLERFKYGNRQSSRASRRMGEKTTTKGIE